MTEQSDKRISNRTEEDKEAMREESRSVINEPNSLNMVGSDKMNTNRVSDSPIKPRISVKMS